MLQNGFLELLKLMDKNRKKKQNVSYDFCIVSWLIRTPKFAYHRLPANHHAGLHTTVDCHFWGNSYLRATFSVTLYSVYSSYKPLL